MYSRPAELIDLLNPVCCSLLIRSAIDGHVQESECGLPYALAMLVLPLVLHKRTREALPLRLTTTLAIWAQRHPELLLELGRRVKSMDVFYREAIIWAMNQRLLSLEGDTLKANSVTPFSKRSFLRTREMESCERASFLIGRWFAKSGNSATIFTLLDVSI